LAVSVSGKVYSWGCNDDGALGRVCDKGTSENRPALVNLPFPVDMISAGDSHSLFCNSQNGVIYIAGVYRNILKGNMSQVYMTP